MQRISYTVKKTRSKVEGLGGAIADTSATSLVSPTGNVFNHPNPDAFGGKHKTILKLAKLARVGGYHVPKI